jgi:addiction module HigA family antidote
MGIKNEGPAGGAGYPGEILREEFLEPMGMSAYRVAVELHVSPPTVNDIVREKRGLTPEMAARVATVFWNLRAVLVESAGRLPGSSGSAKILQGIKSHQAPRPGGGTVGVGAEPPGRSCTRYRAVAD